MKKTFVSTFSILAVMAAPSVLAEDVMGPQPGDEKINQLIIYGDDKCPQSSGDVIVVCARLGEEERYRIPQKLRSLEVPESKKAWTQKVLAYEHVAANGTMSCSAVGAGGFTGCGLKDIDAAYGEKGEDVGLAFGRLIAAERAKRLSGIDAEAEDVEDRVLAEERAAAAKQLQEQGNSKVADPIEEVDDGPLPLPN